MRNLSLYTAYQVLSVEGISHGLYVLWLVQVHHMSPVLAAGILAAGDIALALLQVPTGWLADRCGRRLSLMLGSAFQFLGMLLFWKCPGVVGAGVACVAVAAGDAFRSGADQALLYETCQSLGIAEEFQRRLAAAQFWTLAGLVGLCALGGWLADTWGFDAAWAAECGLTLAGLAVAGGMQETSAGMGSVEVSPVSSDISPWPWSSIAAGTVTSAVCCSVGFLVPLQMSAAGFHAGPIAGLEAGLQFLEAVGAALAVRIRPKHATAVLSLLAAGTLACCGWGGPAVLLAYVACGMAMPLRAAIVLQRAAAGNRAQMASAASAIDMAVKVLWLPSTAALYSWGGSRTVGWAAFLALGILWWAAAAREHYDHGLKNAGPGAVQDATQAGSGTDRRTLN